MKKAELLEAIRRERAELNAIVARVGESGMTDPALDDGWSIKDVVAHITAWEQLCLLWVRTDERGEGRFTQKSLDAMNAKLHDENKDRSLDDVLADARRSYEEFVAMVEEQTDESLVTPPRWADPPLGQVISSNSDDHYREHIDQLMRLLKPPQTLD
jgi:uncharacterized protein (TIGR03083 family)